MDINYKKSFKKDLIKQSKKIKLKFIERLEIFKLDPFNPILNNHALI